MAKPWRSPHNWCGYWGKGGSQLGVPEPKSVGKRCLTMWNLPLAASITTSSCFCLKWRYLIGFKVSYLTAFIPDCWGLLRGHTRGHEIAWSPWSQTWSQRRYCWAGAERMEVAAHVHSNSPVKWCARGHLGALAELRSSVTSSWTGSSLLQFIFCLPQLGLFVCFFTCKREMMAFSCILLSSLQCDEKTSLECPG